MKNACAEAEEILLERFGKDCVIALATVEAGMPDVRQVNALYVDGAIYVITNALSRKMKQIAANPAVAIAGDWFTARGTGINLGPFCKPENAQIACRLKTAFAGWIDNGHSDLQDENTIILCVRLSQGCLLSHGRRYDLTFSS